MKKHVAFLCLALIFAISCKHKTETKNENQFELSFIANQNMGKLNVKLDGKKLESKAFVMAGKTVSFKAKPNDGYCVDYWKINRENKYNGQEEINVKIEKNTDVVLYFKTKPKAYKLTYSFNKNEGSLIVQEAGKNVESGALIKEGTRLIFKATPREDFNIASWTLNGEFVNNTNFNYELEIWKDSNIEVNFSKKTKEEIKVEKIIIEKTEYLNKVFFNEKSLSLLENGKEEILISDDNFDITIYIEKPKDIEVKLIIDNDTIEKLKGSSGIFEKKGIITSEDFKIFKLNLLKDGYIEKNYTFKAKKKVSQPPLIPENLRIKKLSIQHNLKKPIKYVIEPSSNKIDYNVEYPANLAGCCIHLYILGENENAEFKEKNTDYSTIKANGKDYISIFPLPAKEKTKTFIILLTYNGEKIEYNLNIHVKGE